jgi:hypothetical protein
VDLYRSSSVWPAYCLACNIAVEGEGDGVEGPYSAWLDLRGLRPHLQAAGLWSALDRLRAGTAGVGDSGADSGADGVTAGRELVVVTEGSVGWLLRPLGLAFAEQGGGQRDGGCRLSVVSAAEITRWSTLDFVSKTFSLKD